MPIYRMSGAGRFDLLQPTSFPDPERTLEDWIEANPHLLFADEEIAIIARQPRTDFGKYPDLIGIDRTGATVIIELKRGQTPREVLAQVLEYAAWVDTLTLDQLDALAHEYAVRMGFSADGLADIYRRAFESEDEGEDEAPSEVLAKITFNNRQRLVIVAEQITPELEQTLRYLRTKMGMDVSGLVFTLHRQGGETILDTDVVVGREMPNAAAGGRASATPGSHTNVEDWVQTDFLKMALTGVPAWVASFGNPELQLRRFSDSFNTFEICCGPRRLARFYYARKWIYWYLHHPTEQERSVLRSHFGDQKVGKRADGQVAFQVTSEADLDVVKRIVRARLLAYQTPSAGGRNTD